MLFTSQLGINLLLIFEILGVFSCLESFFVSDGTLWINEKSSLWLIRSIHELVWIKVSSFVVEMKIHVVLQTVNIIGRWILSWNLWLIQKSIVRYFASHNSNFIHSNQICTTEFPELLWLYRSDYKNKQTKHKLLFHPKEHVCTMMADTLLHKYPDNARVMERVWCLKK